MKPGETIAWTQYTSSDVISRTGVIWADAELVDGCSLGRWVIPDLALDSDLYAAVYVGKSSRRSQSAHGAYRSDAQVNKGALFASSDSDSPTGRAADFARFRTRELAPAP